MAATSYKSVFYYYYCYHVVIISHYFVFFPHLRVQMIFFCSIDVDISRGHFKHQKRNL